MFYKLKIKPGDFQISSLAYIVYSVMLKHDIYHDNSKKQWDGSSTKYDTVVDILEREYKEVPMAIFTKEFSSTIEDAMDEFLSKMELAFLETPPEAEHIGNVALDGFIKFKALFESHASSNLSINLAYMLVYYLTARLAYFLSPYLNYSWRVPNHLEKLTLTIEQIFIKNGIVVEIDFNACGVPVYSKTPHAL